MNNRTIIIAVVLFALLGGVAVYRYSHSSETRNIDQRTLSAQKECDPSMTTEDCKTISLDTSTWNVFENPEYGYVISYPMGGDNQLVSLYNGMEHRHFHIPGRLNLGGVDATIYPVYPPSNEDVAKKLDLKSYAELVWMLQINSPDPNLHQQVSKIEEIAIDGRKAYAFTLDKGFTASIESASKEHNVWAFPAGYTYRYIITENPQGQKLIIYYYLGNPIAETMFKTFRFK